MDLTDIPLPDDIQVFTCGPLPFMRHVRSTLLSAACRRPESATKSSDPTCGPPKPAPDRGPNGNPGFCC